MIEIKPCRRAAALGFLLLVISVSSAIYGEKIKATDNSDYKSVTA